MILSFADGFIIVVTVYGTTKQLSTRLPTQRRKMTKVGNRSIFHLTLSEKCGKLNTEIAAYNQLADGQAHNLVDAGSSPAAATKEVDIRIKPEYGPAHPRPSTSNH